MSDQFDPYHKWLGIRDRQRPPNHYRLLGLEPFEDDVDVIIAAADQRMAHVRTYQLGPHGALTQKMLNELAAAKVCLLDTSQKGAYDRQLRAKADGLGEAKPGRRDEPAIAAEIPQAVPSDAGPSPENDRPWDSQPSTNQDTPPIDLLLRKIESRPARLRHLPPARRRMIPLPIVVALAVSAVAILGITISFMLGPRSRSQPTTATAPADTTHFTPRTGGTGSPPLPAREIPATRKAELPASQDVSTSAIEKGDRTTPAKSSAVTDSARTARTIETGVSLTALATDLPDRLRSSWTSSSVERSDSDVVLCHQIAQLAYANMAVAALLELPTRKNLEEEIVKAISKIDEYNLFGGSPFLEMVSDVRSASRSVPSQPKSHDRLAQVQAKGTTAQSWQEIDRCFEAYATAVTRLNAVLRNDAPEVPSAQRVTQQVDETERLFHGVLAYVRSRLSKLDHGAALDSTNRLQAIESAASVDSFTAATAVQQVCQWTVRVCEALCLYGGILKSERAGRLQQIAQQIARHDFGSGLIQLRSLLFFELELWAVLVQAESEQSR